MGWRRCGGAALLGLGLAFGAWAEPAPEAPAWSEFRSADGRFRVQLPGTPEHSRTAHRTLAGTVHSGETWIERDGMELRVEYHDIPRVGLLLLSPAAILARAQADLVEEEGGRTLDSRETSWREAPGLRVVYGIAASEPGEGTSQAEALLILLGERLYILVAIHPPGSATESFAPFFASFEAWPD